MKEDKEPQAADKEPVFIKRDDGLGWTINFKRPVSFLIFIIFLALVALACLFAGGFIKL